jgi:MraZ protein
VETTEFYSGCALREVDDSGRLTLPGFVTRVLGQGCEGRAVTFGGHEHDSCLTAYGPPHRRALHREVERRRLLGEARGESSRGHHCRARRVFGLAEDADYDESGRVVLPSMMRSKGGIGQLALFVGAGGTFEIWNPDTAKESGDADLRELAEFHLAAQRPLQ